MNDQITKDEVIESVKRSEHFTETVGELRELMGVVPSEFILSLRVMLTSAKDAWPKEFEAVVEAFPQDIMDEACRRSGEQFDKMTKGITN